MSKTNTQIRERVESFVEDLEVLIRESAVSAVASVLGANVLDVASAPAKAKGPTKSTAPKAAPKAAAPAPKATAPKAAPKATAPKAAAPKAAAPKAAKGGKRIRRSAKEIAAMGQRIADFVAKSPGLRAEQIKKALKLTDGDWALPIKKLVDERRLTVKGQKRATTYFSAK